MPLPASPRPLEPLRHHIPFRRALAARRRLGVLHRLEIALELGDQRSVGTSGEHLADEYAARLEHVPGEIPPTPPRPAPSSAARRSADARRCWPPCPTTPDRARRPVRQAADRARSSSMKSICRMTTPSSGSTGSRSMPTIFALGIWRCTTWLQPPGAMPRSTTNRLALQKAEPLVELDQLVGRAAAIPVGLGALDIRDRSAAGRASASTAPYAVWPS
jgi:hypothetical protein